MQHHYRIPHIQDVAFIVVSYGPFELSVRQVTILMTSSLIAINLWSALPLLMPLVIRIILTALPALLILPFGWVVIQDRHLETWLLALLRYWLTPKIYVWHLPRKSKR